MKKALVLGAGEFIGGHLVNRLKNEDSWVRGIIRKSSSFNTFRIDHLYKNESILVKIMVTADYNKQKEWHEKK